MSVGSFELYIHIRIELMQGLFILSITSLHRVQFHSYA
jgi:hypothetical protein